MRADVALRRTFRKTVKYPQWQNECLAPSLLPQRQSDESVTFLVKRSMLIALQLGRKRVSKICVFHLPA